MHKLTKVSVQNFRSIREADFALSEYTALVGNNNVGKSNLLKAIGWLLKKSSLQAGDFCDEGMSVTVEATIDGIDERVLGSIEPRHRDRIEPHVRDGKLVVRRTQIAPGVSTRDLNIEVLAEDLDGNPSWVVNPNGIEGSISGLLPEPIVIGAMENATDDVAKFSSTSTIGKLLKEVIDPISARYAEEVSEALSPVGVKISSNGTDKDEDLLNFDRMIADELSPLFPGVSAKTHIPLPSFSDFFKGATIRISEGDAIDQERDVGSFGHGVQRSVQIALIKCLARTRAGDRNAGRTTVILVDEPELYLHPQAIEAIRAAFAALAGNQYQLIFSTHSPAMIHRKDVPNTLLMRRTADLGTYALPRVAEAVSDAIENADHQSDILFSLGNASRILFTDKVVLCEGKTERVLLPELFKKLTGHSFDERRMALVEVDSVDSVVKTRQILLKMGIPVFAVVDLDFACRGAIKNDLIDADNGDVISCKETFAALASKGVISLDEAGLPKKHNGEPAARAYEMLAHENAAAVLQLHQRLKDDHAIWVWPMGAIEKQLGLESKQTSAHRVFVERLEDENFIEQIPGIDGVRSVMSWLAGG
ncbi:ATP-dependent nuclease [Thalassospira lohafexi]|uniref:OLD family endonuclease n=1 Tax=Thalassospira lohafexi TaxID=744227 RepID=A0A2N3L6B3_9PROT|nr:AAA family ATPase [Thalassospira lohafexi]PKR58332.1 hypothetical protein COO92_11350 [Thalassospira lohafexi]